MSKVIVISVLALVLFVIDFYVYQAIEVASKDLSANARIIIKYAFWGLTGLSLAAIVIYNFGNPDWFEGNTRSLIISGVFVNYFSKMFAVLFIFTDDLVRLGKWVMQGFNNPEKESIAGEVIPRSEFLTKAALVAGAVPLVGMSYGIISGAHDYRFRRKSIVLPNLPKAFDGIRLVQISDIHSGSFFNKIAVKGGVDMLMKEKPDLVFFTGDLVNSQTDEVKDYISIFEKVKAPLGVYSVLGNHDYGDYRSWSSAGAKQANLADMHQAHKELGWDLLLNENRLVTVDGEDIGVLGVENWGAGRFAKYGKLNKAHQGVGDTPVKILLSHDPSHWDAQVRKEYADIDLMLAGHTHGFQFGVEIGGFKWSPAQYAYKQWAGLYQEGSQYLYVNRGYGYIGFPGRVGIPPEITVLELKSA